MVKEELSEEKEPIKVWKTSITKTELAELPAETFAGNISVVNDRKGLDEAVEYLKKSKALGFDTETKPSFKRGEHHTVSLLQLSDTRRCFLFRLNSLGLPEEVKQILEDEKILKVGLSIHDDFLNLHKIFKFEPRGFVELQTFVKDYNIADNSLSRIYAILFDKRISKGQRLSNWEAENLSEHQKQYAALDAQACLNIYNHLTKKGFDYLQSKYYREFDEPQN